ncbi:sensor histidine kinase [Pseudogemmobacter humi]|uniref:histidine kinase n=1 Tax=Pseudogemmobacter humi TaxID=2483812 RepID=A0A3P5XFP5_9RHOB|nr:sensor histidine kinase [Pseudogemmobacter humi]VDC33652.1 putative sensor histidine kinase pdtaS [Pseudogemmobacter humi]
MPGRRILSRNGPFSRLTTRLVLLMTLALLPLGTIAVSLSSGMIGRDRIANRLLTGMTTNALRAEAEPLSAAWQQISSLAARAGEASGDEICAMLAAEPGASLLEDGAALFNRQGERIGGADPGAALPPATVLDLIARAAPDGAILGAPDHGGGDSPLVFVASIVVPGQVFAIAGWPGSAPPAPLAPSSYMPLAFPALMWLASLGVIFMSLDYLLLRHLRNLNRQMRRFALGHPEPWQELNHDAPTELRQLNTTFQNMARIIARDEQELESALSEKSALLREVHHRVRNNLQLISSIINLQLRQIDDPAARRVLRDVQDRVLCLAIIHYQLHGAERLSDLRADQVLEQILRQLVAARRSPGREPGLTLRIAPLAIPADRMVPLAFLLTEAVSDPIRRMESRNDPLPWIDVRLSEPAPGTGLLEVATADPENGGGGLPMRDRIRDDLIRAFAGQLGGSLETASAQDPRGPARRLRLSFATGTGTGTPQPALPG